MSISRRSKPGEEDVTATTSRSVWRGLCAVRQGGSDTRACHWRETHWKRHTDFTGSLERMSKMRSSGTEAGELMAMAALLVWRRRRSGEPCGAMAVFGGVV
jgi:hypothetical protein